MSALSPVVANAQQKVTSSHPEMTAPAETNQDVAPIRAGRQDPTGARTAPVPRETQQRVSRRLVGSPVAGANPAIGPDYSTTRQSNPLSLNSTGPISNCVTNGGGGITCDIYETDASGNPSEISNVIPLPLGVTGGYLVLKSNSAAPDSDQTQWSDVLIFAPTGGTASTVQLFSAGCNTANPNDRTCFPTFATVSGDPDSGFINETKGGPTIFVAGPNIYNIFSISDNAPRQPFTLAASVGTVDEDSATIAQLKNFTVTFLPAATGAVHVRYDITALNDISRFCPATQSVIRVRFRNTDNSGLTANVSFEIHSTNVTSGGNNIVYTFNSNGRGAGGAFTTATDSPAIDFDFANNIYWIEATLTRSNTTQLADLGSIQIWETGLTACQ